MDNITVTDCERAWDRVVETLESTTGIKAYNMHMSHFLSDFKDAIVASYNLLFPYLSEKSIPKSLIFIAEKLHYLEEKLQPFEGGPVTKLNILLDIAYSIDGLFFGDSKQEIERLYTGNTFPKDCLFLMPEYWDYTEEKLTDYIDFTQPVYGYYFFDLVGFDVDEVYKDLVRKESETIKF